ncbi:Creatinine amidohydrolase [bacterium HR17]|jgi:creatinine amidohydrolase|uniref:Creatinine amidohydrolase n=1 Tax=Candidatus Fervidibacter japonicus TaxID=2035412 RepID=A0A2H5X8W5_9BACT|nr:Creatinine amidohydrolase [bacterium HR17]
MRQEVVLERLTRREVRQRLESGALQAAVIAVGSIEQHLEHLPLCHDIQSAFWVAEQAALSLFPRVIVTVPVSIGISEHWMWAKGTLTAKPGSWLAVVFDAVDSLFRHGIRHVLILNGHAGNVAPVQGVLRQWRLYFARQYPGSNLQFASYWDFIPREIADQVLQTKRLPGHAQEFETAIALHAFPDLVRHDAIADQDDPEPRLATSEQGRQLAEIVISKLVAFLSDMMDGTIKMPVD